MQERLNIPLEINIAINDDIIKLMQGSANTEDQATTELKNKIRHFFNYALIRFASSDDISVDIKYGPIFRTVRPLC